MVGIKRAHVGAIESGLRRPSMQVAIKLSKTYQIPTETLLHLAGYSDMLPSVQHPVKPVPVKGYISAGVPKDVYEVDLGTVPIRENLVNEYSDLFALIVSGDSLQGDDIQDRDVVLVIPFKGFSQGGIYIVRIDGELCARHVHVDSDGNITLKSANHEYPDIASKRVEPVGEVVYSIAYRNRKK